MDPEVANSTVVPVTLGIRLFIFKFEDLAF